MKADATEGRGLRQAAPWIWLALLIALAYGGALRNDYVWDDVYFFGAYVWVHDFGTALGAAFQPLFDQGSYVRPIPLLMLYMEAIASDRNPTLSHAINLVIHWGCSGLVLLLSRRALDQASTTRLAGSSWMPLLLASVFAVHPALSEAPIWISSRFDLMATFWILLALWVSDLQVRDVPRALMLGLLFFVGALCKESVVVFPLLLGAYALLKGGASRPGGKVQLSDAFSNRDLKAHATVLVAGLAYLVIRHHVLSGSDLIQLTRPMPAEWLSRTTTTISTYLQLTVMPFIGSSPHHTWTWPQDGSLTTFWPAHAIALSFAGTAIALVVARRPAGWWLLIWLLAYLPVLHLIPLPIGQNIVHQRFMYLPTAVLIAFAPYVLANLPLSKIARRASIALTLAIIVISIPVDRSIVRVWRSDLALWTWATRAQPESVQARENMILALLENDMYEEAEQEFLFIVKNKMNTSANLAVNMGTAMYRQEEYEGALHYYRKAEEHHASLSRTFRSRLFANIGIANANLGNTEQAKAYLLKALEENPRNYTAIGHLLGYCQAERLDTAVFDQKDVELARVTAEVTVSLLQKHQPLLQSKNAFCPEFKDRPSTP